MALASRCFACGSKKTVDDMPFVALGPGTRSLLTDVLDEYVILGNDPRLINIFYMAFKMPNGTTQSWKHTRQRNYTNSESKKRAGN